MTNIFDIKVLDKDRNETTLSEYKGKVLLIVNTATECGFTPHYEQLQSMYEKYKDEGLVILDFPCDQFGHQAPGTEQEIAKFCSSRFGVNFPMYAKIDVNGEKETELFRYLKDAQGFKGFGEGKTAEFMKGFVAKEHPDYESTSDIKWNFTKFLIDRDGQVIDRFEPTMDMALVEEKVASVIKKR
ncbi:glutathione peroxidase [Oribacterium sp. WCC10]|uniref:glutathione peroxidase n=1 Tax=Oribacterium sp. WCC10 TaxID=1855343 RepID=UPI0008ECBED9|nr:glutathione peroxidase [Oribacterium sp. WCC10]SFG34948.1 glutathione peroxidase [Oribacterium sp. WCC10]